MVKETTSGTFISKNRNKLCGISVNHAMLNMLCDMCCEVVRVHADGMLVIPDP